MISNTVKIFDLLGGIVPQPDGTQSPKDQGLVEDSRQVFDVLLGQITSSTIPQLPVLEVGSTKSTEENIASIIESTNTIIDELSDSESIELISNANPAAGSENPIFDLMEFAGIDNLEKLSPIDSKAVKQLQADIGQELVGVNSSVKNSKDQSANLPIVNLDKLSTGDINRNSFELIPRISDEIFSKLNLKEIQIKSEPSISSSGDKFKSEFAEIQSALKPVLGKNGIEQASKTTESTGQQLSDVTLSENVLGSDEDNSNPHLNNKEVARSANSNKSEDHSDVIDGFDAIQIDENSNLVIKSTHNSNLDSKTFFTNETDKGSVELKSNQSVKLSIPETVKLTGDQKSYSVMIKIEPEHLGPARLDLHVKNDILSAKLTVETAAAKTTLENSINSLKEQLARCDIKVDQIEVNVRGETNYNQLFEKQAQWQKFGSGNHFRFSGSELLEQFIPSNEIINSGMLQFVGSNGVNILA